MKENPRFREELKQEDFKELNSPVKKSDSLAFNSAKVQKIQTTNGSLYTPVKKSVNSSVFSN